MPQKLELSGQRFNRLLVGPYLGTDGRNSMFLCTCDCGNSVVSSGYRIKTGHTKSCGCLQRERASECAKQQGTHYMSNSPEYQSWRSMKRRCEDLSDINYGGRGITVYSGWVNDFAAFYAYMGPRPEGCTLDRIDVNGNYEPGNVRWLNVIGQNNNRRKYCVLSKFTDEELMYELERRTA